MSRPRRKQQEALIFVVNVGKTSSETLENENQSFLDKSKNVIKQVLERKIFMRINDTANIICFGSNVTKNDKNMDNIYQFQDELLAVSWEMVQKVLNIRATNQDSCWVEGLHVALDFARQKRVEFNGLIKILVLNNFKENEDVIEQFNARSIAREVLDSGADLMFISSDNIGENMDNMNRSHQLALRIGRQLNPESDDPFHCDFEQIDDYLWETRFYKNPPKTPTAWKCPLKIGKISIPTETYVKITEPPPFPSWKLTTRSDSVGFPPESEIDIQRETKLVDRHRNVTELENTIKGFKYGGRFIPFSDEDIARAKFQEQGKSLMIRGFAKKNELPLENWFGKGCHIIVPEKHNQRSIQKFNALLLLLKQKEYVGIVRRVYCRNSVPKMGILFPKLEEGEIACFIMIQMPFVEERRILNPRPQVELESEEKKKDVEDLIDAMTLPKTDERFKPGSFCNPCKQNKWDNLSHRALNRVPLPPMDKVLVNLISTPESLIKLSKPIVERLSEWVKPKETLLTKNEKNETELVNDNEAQEPVKTEEELIKAAEEAEKQQKVKEDIFNEIDESAMILDDDFLDDM